jgi:hypothetical protein
MNLLFNIIIAYILGVILFFLVNYCFLKFSKIKNSSIFTNGISSEIITFKDNYQEILSSKLNRDDEGYFIDFGSVNKVILKHG